MSPSKLLDCFQTPDILPALCPLAEDIVRQNPLHGSFCFSALVPWSLALFLWKSLAQNRRSGLHRSASKSINIRCCSLSSILAVVHFAKKSTVQQTGSQCSRYYPC